MPRGKRNVVETSDAVVEVEQPVEELVVEDTKIEEAPEPVEEVAEIEKVVAAEKPKAEKPKKDTLTTDLHELLSKKGISVSEVVKKEVTKHLLKAKTVVKHFIYEITCAKDDRIHNIVVSLEHDLAKGKEELENLVKAVTQFI